MMMVQFMSVIIRHNIVSRVATVREKSLVMNFFQVREKLGNFNFSQGNLDKMIKVREKSGNLRSFQKSQLVKKF